MHCIKSNRLPMYICRRLRPDGKVEDLGDFSDFYIPPDTNMGEAEAKHLREMQDEVRLSENLL